MKIQLKQLSKKISGIFGLLILIPSVQAALTFPVYEPFSQYTDGERLRLAGSSGTNWTTGNSLSNTDSPLVTNTAALSYPGLLPDTVNAPPKGIYCASPTGTGRTHGAPIPPQPTNNGATIYLSLLLSPQTFPSSAVNGGYRPIIGLHGSSVNPPTVTPDPRVGPTLWINSLGQLQISKNASAALGPPATNATTALTVGGKYFVVLAYKFQAGFDEVDLWVNPTSLGGSAPTPTLAITNNNDTGANINLNQIGLYAGTGVPLTTNLIDEIRVDTTWAGVTPASPAPGPIFNVTGGGNGCPGDSFVVGLSGSVATNDYYLYTNTVFAGQVITGTGSAVNFGAQTTTATYNIVASNTLSGNIAWMNGSVTISVLAGPAITAQPTAVSVATNGTAAFTVTATGSGLNYQWYRNGTGLANAGHFSGVTTPVLTITPATTADAATTAVGYYVIITNSCALSATSVTNSLTLVPPANLVWQGANLNTNWDLATTANWTNSAGTFLVFNSGDNVKFDDSSTNQVVTMVGNLAPTLVSYNSSLNYFIRGSGALVGTGSLLVNGPGTLTLSNANLYTHSGGTTISNGVLVLKNSALQTLGSGPLTLAGGKLEVGLSSSSASGGLSNNINVTANSTLQYDGAGTFALVIQSPLTGSPGATLTIQNFLNNSATPDRIRMYSNFTNNSPVVITSVGNMMELAAYHTNADQVFNGVISGSGGRIVARGNGNIILNGANTFNDSAVLANGSGPNGYSVLLSSGNVGVGADSVSSSPPTIDSSPLGTGNLGINVSSAEGGTGTVFASGGARTVGNPVVYTSATNTVTFVIGGSNNLTFSGAINLQGLDATGGTNRTIQINNTAMTTFSGVIGDGALVCGLIKIGTGTLALSGMDTYTGPTTVGAGALWVNGKIGSGAVTVTNGSLGGTGTLLGAVTVSSPGTLAPGTSAIGTLTVSNNLLLAGNALFKLNKSLAQSNDIANVTGTLSASGAGTLTVTNLGAALAVGDKFKLFSAAVTGGSTLTIAGGGMNWTNKLAIDGSIQALSAISSLASYSTNITASVSGSTLNVTWPATHLGWILQSQTNNLSTGLNTNWADIAGSASVTTLPIPLNPANPTVFIRLRHP